MDTKIKYQIDQTLETEDKAYEVRKKESKRPEPHPYPKPRKILSAHLAIDDSGEQYIRALIECGSNGILGIRTMNIPPDTYKQSRRKAKEEPEAEPEAEAEAEEEIKAKK